MDTTKLIEEAEALANAATPGPWCHNSYGVNNWPGPEAPTRVMELLHNQDDDEEQNHKDAMFIARARTLVPELAAALRATTARAEALSLALTYAETKRGKDFDYDEWVRLLDSARSGAPAAGAHEVEIELHAGTRKRAETAEKQSDALAAANLAANKRIEALEHERDAARRQAQENAEHALDIAKDRDAARAERARLTTPRPIAEAPKGIEILGYWEDRRFPVIVSTENGDVWFSDFGAVRAPTHFLPLPVLP